MKPSRKLLLLTAAAAVIPVLWAGVARAQFRVDDGGHALDANNRVGSNGYNDNGQVGPRAMGITPNDIVYGNVTGLDYFHGSTQDNDPDINSAWTASAASDRLNAIAGPVNYAARSGTPQNTVYYNPVTLNRAPPANFVSTPGGAGIVPAPVITNQVADSRLGLVTSTPDQAASPLPGELDMVGPYDASGSASALTLSPLYGIRGWRTDDPSDMYFLSRYSNVQLAAPTDASKLDNASIQKMRQELNGTIVQGPNGQPAQGAQAGQPNGQSGNTAANPSDLTGKPSNAAVGQQALNSSLGSQSINSSVNTNQGTQEQVLELPSPSEQSTQVAELQQRRAKLLAASKTKLTDAQAAQLYNQEQQYRSDVKSSQQLAKPAPLAGTTPTPTSAAPSANAAPGKPGTNLNPTPTANKISPGSPTPVKPLKPVVTTPMTPPAAEQPYVITSLATGIRAPGLAELLKSGEEQMRQGKFNAALDTYDAAQEVAPNNPFITLGRGFAELGASYYGRANADLRRSIESEPAVLVGRYDLKGFLGQDRLQFITKDLQDISQSEKDSAQAPLLLAFLAHNAGDDQKAATYLDMVQQRTGGKPDSVVEAMRENWGIQSTGK